METDERMSLMNQRSFLSEGTFENLKENWRYSRFCRRGKSNVKKIHLMAIRANLGKYQREKVEKMNQAEEMIAKYLH